MFEALRQLPFPGHSPCTFPTTWCLVEGTPVLWLTAESRIKHISLVPARRRFTFALIKLLDINQLKAQTSRYFKSSPGDHCTRDI